MGPQVAARDKAFAKWSRSIEQACRRCPASKIAEKQLSKADMGGCSPNTQMVQRTATGSDAVWSLRGHRGMVSSRWPLIACIDDLQHDYKYVLDHPCRTATILSSQAETQQACHLRPAQVAGHETGRKAGLSRH
jgi:hypothetical protein